MYLLEGLIRGRGGGGRGFLSSQLWFQFPVLSRIRAQEAKALGKRVPTGPFGMSWLWMFLQFSPELPCRKTGRVLLPSSQPLVQAEWIKLKLMLGAGMDTLAHARIATLQGWGLSFGPPQASPPPWTKCEPGSVNVTWLRCSNSGPARPSMLKMEGEADF